jgi:hypothetical protein
MNMSRKPDSPLKNVQQRHSSHRRVKVAVIALLVAVAALAGEAAISAQGRGYGQADLAHPAPPAVAEYYPYVYGGERILKSATVDENNSTVTLPLYRGKMKDGRTVWYVLTDVSDRRIAARKGLNYAPKLRNAPDNAVRTARMERNGTLIFDQGTVDFAPERKVVPGDAPNFFPPAVAQAGSVGDAAYSPLVRVTNAGNIVYNATIVAFDVQAHEIEFPHGNVDYTKVIDRAVAISPANGTITFSLNLGTSGGKPVLFISLDSNDNLLSALEATNVAPELKNLPVGLNDQPDSAVSVNYIITYGATGANNPQRQGVNSALGDPNSQVFDIFDGAPGILNGAAYSPMWDLYLAQWTPEAQQKGYVSRIYSELQFLGLARQGWLTGPDGGAIGPSGLISNCPLIMHY